MPKFSQNAKSHNNWRIRWFRGWSVPWIRADWWLSGQSRCRVRNDWTLSRSSGSIAWNCGKAASASAFVGYVAMCLTSRPKIAYNVVARVSSARNLLRAVLVLLMCSVVSAPVYAQEYVSLVSVGLIHLSVTVRLLTVTVCAAWHRRSDARRRSKRTPSKTQSLDRVRGSVTRPPFGMASVYQIFAFSMDSTSSSYSARRYSHVAEFSSISQ